MHLVNEVGGREERKEESVSGVGGRDEIASCQPVHSAVTPPD